jgi:hypothetical protein
MWFNVMLIPVRNMSLTFELHKATKLKYKITRNDAVDYHCFPNAVDCT